MLKVGLIGLGMMGSNHARVLNSLDGVQLSAVVDPLKENVKLDRNIPLFPNFDDLKNQNLDYCVIAAPTIHHEKISLWLIEEEIPFLIEKPLSFNLKSAIRIITAAKSKNVQAGVGHIERYNSALQTAKIKIAEGVLGNIYQISTRRQGFFPSRISDVGVVLDLATHDIDLTSWIVDSEYESISANSTSRSGRAHEDLISVTGKLKGDVVVNHIVNWLSPLKERNIQIVGEKGVFVIDTLLSDLTFYENGSNYLANSQVAFFKGVSQGQVIKYAFDKHEPLRAEHEAFRDMILGKDSHVVTLESAAETIRVAEAILESAESNKNIKL
jgi:UDP-N-acetylglucosamine 3-dehydrogenase